MNFVTIHDLSRELNIPARVVRYRFHQLRLAGKLAEGGDFRRDDFVDEQHFTWMINPLSYMRETGKAVAPPPAGIPMPEVPQPILPPAGYHASNQSGNNPQPSVNQVVNQQAPPVTQAPPVGNQSGNHAEARPERPSLEREMIEFLKEQVSEKDSQIHTKDEQIKGLSGQLKEVSDLNVRLVGQNVLQANQIQDLLKLAAGNPAAAKVVTNYGNHEDDLVNEVVNNESSLDNSVDTNPATAGNQVNHDPTHLPHEQGSGAVV